MPFQRLSGPNDISQSGCETKNQANLPLRVCAGQKVSFLSLYGRLATPQVILLRVYTLMSIPKASPAAWLAGFAKGTILTTSNSKQSTQVPPLFSCAAHVLTGHKVFEMTGIRSSYQRGHISEATLRGLKRKCMCAHGYSHCH